MSDFWTRRHPVGSFLSRGKFVFEAQNMLTFKAAPALQELLSKGDISLAQQLMINYNSMIDK